MKNQMNQDGLPRDTLLTNIKSALLRRREENTGLGIQTKDNVFDSRLLAIYGEEFLCGKLPGSTRSTSINEAAWDIRTADGKTVQVKSRAVYLHNVDAIHIDFKENLNFDFLFLLLVDEGLKHLCTSLIRKERLAPLLFQNKKGGFRMRDIRRRYLEYQALSEDAF